MYTCPRLSFHQDAGSLQHYLRCETYCIVFLRCKSNRVWVRWMIKNKDQTTAMERPSQRFRTLHGEACPVQTANGCVSFVICSQLTCTKVTLARCSLCDNRCWCHLSLGRGYINQKWMKISVNRWKLITGWLQRIVTISWLHLTPWPTWLLQQCPSFIRQNFLYVYLQRSFWKHTAEVHDLESLGSS